MHALISVKQRGHTHTHVCPYPQSKRPTGMIYKMRTKHLERHAKKKNRQNLNLFEDIGCLEMAIMIEEKGKEFPQRFIFYYLVSSFKFISEKLFCLAVFERKLCLCIQTGASNMKQKRKYSL